MPKVLPKIGPYDVITDTNALFALEPKKLVSGGFESALTEVRKIAPVHLHIPQVVLGELAYQKYKAAAAALESAARNIETIFSITGEKVPRLVTNSRAKQRIIRRYELWCKSVGAKILKPKIRQRTWEKLLDDAIWRIPPFEHSEDKDRKHEKGFRDRVVLEALIQFCKSTQNEVIFLCQDGLLSKGVQNCGLNKLTILPRLEDFASRIRLLKENSESEWVNELFSAATREFYEEGNANCIYSRSNIYKLIGERIADLTPPIGVTGLFLTPKHWERRTDEQITLGTSQFEENRAGRAQWTTEVKSAAAFSGKDLLDLVHEGIRVSTFSVKWSSVVSQAAEISDTKFESIELKDRLMSPDSAEERIKWSLPAKLMSTGLSLANLLGSPTNTTPG